MCYFFSLAEEEIRLQKRYNSQFEIPGKFKGEKLINGFTFPDVPILTNEFPNLFRFFKWGFIPNWTKSKNEALAIRKMTLNARLETIFDKPSFSSSAKYYRCLIPVNGFYEWQHEGSKKVKHYIKLIDHKIFSLGGLWSEWVDKETGEIYQTFSVVTMPANPIMEKIHNTKKRMPVILPSEIEFEWLKRDANQSYLFELANYCSEDRLWASPYDND